MQNHFMGDILQSSASKPVQLTPYVKIKDEFRKFRFQKQNWESINIQNMINELSLFIYSNSKTKIKIPKNTFKQFQYPYYYSNKECELEIKKIIEIISSFNNTTFYKINIFGNNILKYSHINQLVDLLNSFGFRKEYFFDFDDIFHTDFLKFVKQVDKKSTINISLTLTENAKDFNNIYKILINSKNKIKFQLIISNYKTLQLADVFIKLFKIETYVFKPLYTTNNLHFFKKSIFISKNEILNAKLTMDDIYSRQLVNDYDYGKLTIMADGKIYANLNDPVLGNASKNSLEEVVLKEIKQGKSWKRLRTRVMPCRHCVFQHVCPPISNYELVLKKYNLCKVF